MKTDLNTLEALGDGVNLVFLIIQLTQRQVSPVLKSIFIYRTLKLTKSHYTI